MKSDAGKTEASYKREREQAELLEQFFRHTYDCIVLLDRDFNFIRVNQAYADICKRDINDFAGYNHFELYPSPLIEDFRKVVATGIPYQAYARPFTFPDHPEWGETYWDLSLVPIRDANGEVNLLLFTLKDVTDRHRAEFALSQTNRALRTISACNSMLVHAASESELLEGMCRLIVEYGGYCMAWVGYARDDAQKTVKVQACAGHATEYLTSVRISWADDEYGHRPSGTAIRTGKTTVVQNLETAECSSWCDQALSCGYSSVIALPLREGDKTFGVLSIFANEPDLFKNEEEVSLLTELAEDISFGICGLRLAAAHQQAEHKLVMSEERHRLVLDYAADAVLTADPEGHFIYANEQAQKMLGYSSDELSGMSIPDITQPDEVEVALGIFEQVKALGHVRAEVKLKSRDGSVIPVEVNTVRLPDGNYFGSFRDITERRLSGEKLKASEARYREMIEQNPLMCFELDSAGTVISVNNQAVSQLGFTAGELVGQPVTIVFPEYLHDAVRGQLDICIREPHRVHKWEIAKRRKDGSRLWVSETAIALREDNQRPTILVMCENITERKLGVEALQNSEAHYKTLFEQTLDYVLILELAAGEVPVIVDASEAALAKHGYSRAELIGKPISFLDKSMSEAELKERLSLVAAGGPIHFEAEHQCKDGTSFPVDVAMQHVAIGGKSLLYSVERDISDRKRTEKQIAEYIRQLEESMQGTLQAVSNMVEQRDPYTAGHERRVGTIAADIGRELGWPEDRCKNLQLIGLVHDIGKISIPSEILSKPSRLTALEYELVKGHVERGFEILRDVKFPLPIAEIIRQHHERMDGSGYPQGLKGEEILPEARILAVADVLESMSSHRPYRPALGVEVALKEIVDHRGTGFDTEVVDALLRLIREKEYQLPT